MASITTRETAAGFGDRTGITNNNAPLTNSEIDRNFIELNNDKLEESDCLSTNTADAVVRRDGSGGFSAGAISATSLTATTITETSSIAFKENVSPLGVSGLDIVSKLNGVTFDWKDKELGENVVGLIAEEVDSVAPRAVTHKDGAADGIQYNKLVVYLIEAVKELNAEIKQLKGEK
jgi:hypothetical protein